MADLRAGSETAWSDAVRLLGPPLRGFIGLRGAPDPDEVLGEVFLELSRAADRVDDDWSSFRKLAFVIARRRVVDAVRAAVRRPGVPIDVPSLESRVAGDVEEEAMARLDRQWVLELLETLTPIQRDILTMRFVSGLTIREVADVLGATETGVKANQRRALATLRRRLGAPGSPPVHHPSDPSDLTDLAGVFGGRW